MPSTSCRTAASSLTAADCPADSKTITVVASFKEAESANIEATVTGTRFGNSDMNGLTIVFAGTSSGEFEVKEGKITGVVNVGEEYTVTIEEYTGGFIPLKVTADKEGNLTVNGTAATSLDFVYDAFTANLIGGTEGTAIDDSNANTEKYITATEGGRIWAVMNEGSLDSVFTATFSSKTSTNNDAFRTVIYTFEDKNGVIPLVKLGDENKIKVEWQGWAEFGVNSINPIWNTKQYGGELFEAYNGDGIDFIMVRSGRTVYVFLSVADKPETAVFYDSYTFDAKYEGVKGHFGIGVGSDAPAGSKLYFDYSDKAEDVAAWVAKVPTQE